MSRSFARHLRDLTVTRHRKSNRREGELECPYGDGALGTEQADIGFYLLVKLDTAAYNRCNRLVFRTQMRSSIDRWRCLMLLTKFQERLFELQSLPRSLFARGCKPEGFDPLLLNYWR